MVTCVHGTGVGILHVLCLCPELGQLGPSHALAPFSVHLWSIQPGERLRMSRIASLCWRGTSV